MSTPALPESARTEILQAAPHPNEIKEIGEALSLKDSTLRSRIKSFGIWADVKALLGTELGIRAL